MMNAKKTMQQKCLLTKCFFFNSVMNVPNIEAVDKQFSESNNINELYFHLSCAVRIISCCFCNVHLGCD